MTEINLNTRGDADGEIERVPSLVPGLDAILCGGFLRGGLYIVQGSLSVFTDMGAVSRRWRRSLKAPAGWKRLRLRVTSTADASECEGPEPWCLTGVTAFC